MVPVRLPKEVLNLFPTWEYCCPSCSTYVESNISFCPNCKTPFDEKMWRVPPRFLKSQEAMSKYAHKVLAPKLTPKQRELLFQHFTIFFQHGFEGGDFGVDPETGDSFTGITENGSSTTDVVSTSSPYQGTYHQETIIQASSSDGAYAYKALGSDYSEIFVRLYGKVDAWNSEAAIFLALVGDTYSQLNIYRDEATQKWGLRYSDSQWGWNKVTESGTSGLPTASFVCLEVYWKHHATEGIVSLWLDDVQIINAIGVDVGFRDVDEIRVGVPYVYPNQQSSPRTIHADCVVVADTYIGPGGGAQTYTKTWTTDALFKRFDVLKSFALDARFGALMTQTISRQIDVLLKRLDATKTFGVDVYFGPAEAGTYAKDFALDVIFAYKVRLPELWLDENGKIVLNISKPYTWVGS